MSRETLNPNMRDTPLLSLWRVMRSINPHSSALKQRRTLMGSVGLLLVLGTFIIGCSAPPPPPPPPPPPWSTVIQKEAPTRVKKITFSMELWTDAPTPKDTQKIEDDLAFMGVVADLSGSVGRYRVAVGDSVCQVNWTSADSKIRGERVSLCASQLDAQSAPLLSKAGHRILFECQSPSIGALIDAHNITIGFAHKRESVWVGQPFGICQGKVKKQRHFSTTSYVTTESRLMGDSLAIWTRGMSAFGLKEISFIGVDPQREEVGKERLLAMADLSLRQDGQGIGQEVSSGMVSGVYISADQLKTPTPLLSVLRGMLTLVDPKASMKSWSAQRALMNRFTLPE